MTEHEIEARAERLMDNLDRRLMAGEISQAEYDQATKTLDHNVAGLCDEARARQAEGVRLLGAYTAGTYDLWSLAGPAKATCRAHIMGALLGRKATQKESGVIALRRTFYDGAQPPTGTLAAQESHFVAWCKARAEGRS